jgi:hypothetical protein
MPSDPKENWKVGGSANAGVAKASVNATQMAAITEIRATLLSSRVSKPPSPPEIDILGMFILLRA